MNKPTLFHIPVCPFSQRIEILLTLKGQRNDIDFHVVDITQPRPEWLLQKTRGSTVLPILETRAGHILKESLVILQYLDDVHPERPVAQRDPYRRAVENMLTRMEGEFATQGYVWLMNQQPERRNALRTGMLKLYQRLNAFLLEHSPKGPFLFDEFGWTEVVFTPFFMRFWFLEYYEEFHLPDDEQYARVRQWVTKEEVVKLHRDYAKGAGNGALLPGREKSSFSSESQWERRPWPLKNKYDHGASDQELGPSPVSLQHTGIPRHAIPKPAEITAAFRPHIFARPCLHPKHNLPTPRLNLNRRPWQEFASEQFFRQWVLH